MTALTLARPSATRLAIGCGRSRRPAGRLGIELWLGRRAGHRARARRHPARPGRSCLRRDGAPVRLHRPGMRLDWPAPPANAAAWSGRSGPRRTAAARRPRRACAIAALTAIAAPGAADALLGVETGGIAPAFSPLDEAGGLTRTARAWLAAQGVTAEAALADVLAGGNPLPVAGAGAHVAMHDAVAPFVHAMPARPEPIRQPDASRRAGANCRRGGPATRRRPRSAATGCICAPASMTTARWARCSSRCTRRARRSAA